MSLTPSVSLVPCVAESVQETLREVTVPSVSRSISRASAPALSDASAEELAVRAQQGGTDGVKAFSELVERFNGRLYNYLARRFAYADAEDLTQETFIRAWQRIETYNPRYRFSTWLFTIGTRLAVSHGRSARRSQPLELVGDPGRSEEPGAAAVRQEERRRIWSMVGELLNEEQQTAMWLRYVEGMAIVEIARVMGRTQVSVRVMLFRARGILAEKLEQTEDGVREVGPPARSKLAPTKCAEGAA